MCVAYSVLTARTVKAHIRDGSTSACFAIHYPSLPRPLMSFLADTPAFFLRFLNLMQVVQKYISYEPFSESTADPVTTVPGIELLDMIVPDYYCHTRARH